MKDFAVIVRSPEGQSFGVSGQYILEREAPAPGCTNRWLFQLPNAQILEVIIVDAPKSELASLLGHWRELLKVYVRRFGNRLSKV